MTDIEFGDLEELARVDLEPGEREKLRLQLDRILGFVRKLQDIDTGDAGAEGEGAPHGAAPAPDEPRDCLDRDEVLGQAPESEGGFFRVPPVIDREGGGGS